MSKVRIDSQDNEAYLGEKIISGGGVSFSTSNNDIHDQITVAVASGENLVHVSKDADAEFQTIQSALDSITDASVSKIYVVMIQPGVYEENLILKDW